MSDAVWPHRWQPTRLLRPWDSPGKNTGVSCHFLLQCIKVKSEREVAQSCLILRDLLDYRPPGSSLHGIFQARVLEWGAIAFSYRTNKNWLTLLFIPVFKFQNPTAYSGFWFVQNPITWLLAGVSDNYCFNKNQYFLIALKCTRQNKGKELDHSSSSLKQNKASR